MKYILSIIGLIGVLLFSSCKKYFDVNRTPNNPLEVPPATILPVTQISMAFANANELGRAASVLVQHNAGLGNQVLQEDIYSLDNQFDNQWSFELYGNGIVNLRTLIKEQEAANPLYSGMAKIQMAYMISIATDLFGDVPYSEAAMGEANLTPRFDKQEDIYQGNAALGIQSLFDLVKSGLADLDKNTGVFKPGSDDLIYKGDISKWKRAANTMLLKFAMQISNRNPTLAKSTIDAVIAGNNYINSNAVDFEVPFGSTVGNQNPLYSYNFVNTFQGTLILSTRYRDLMYSLNDTVRLAKQYTKPNGVFTTFDNGAALTAPALPPAATRSKYNTYLTGTGEAPIRLLTFAQVNFILAESALILATAGDPNTYYQAGIRAHMQKTGMTTAEIDQYFLTNPTVVTLSGNTETKRRQIITQKYISWVGNSIEAYNDYRRTRYPALALTQNAAGDNPNVLPERFPYTPNEISRNPNVPLVNGVRPQTDLKVWWAK
ncbi:MAG TPA: SusD/RagB family nutrient-binding outer membrane lipoprotein [Flavisolibacter sp.]